MFDRQEIFEKYNYTCQCCGYFGDHSRLSIAHKIKQGKGTIKYIKNYFSDYNFTDKHIKDNIINNEKNVTLACRGNCNDSFNLFYKPLQRDFLLDEIIRGEKNGK